MFKYLDRLRKKGEPERRKAALGLASAVTLVIFLFWLAVLLKSSPSKPAGGAEAESIYSPFRTLFEDFSSAFGELKKSF